MPEQYLSYIYKCLLLKQIFWRVKGKHRWQPVVSFLAHDFQHIQKWSENGVRSEEEKPWYWSLSELCCEHSCAWPCTSLIWTRTLMRWVDSLAWPWTLDHHRRVSGNHWHVAEQGDHHGTCSAHPAQALWDCALAQRRTLLLLALLSLCTPGSPFLAERPSCCQKYVTWCEKRFPVKPVE